MSSAKFASMTASLLARKGEAAPSLDTLPVRPSAFADGKPPFPPPPPKPEEQIVRSLPSMPSVFKPQAAAPAPASQENHADRPRRIVITLTADEFEKLGIAAIKKDKTRHEIVRSALDAYFHQLAAALPRTCNCMADGPCCA